MSNKEEHGEGAAVGRGKTLDQAVSEGYEKMKRRGASPPFRVEEIWAEGTNPFSGYRVVLRS